MASPRVWGSLGRGASAIKRGASAKHQSLPPTTAKEVLHPVQAAWIEQQVPQCGFCQSGMMIKATELLETKPKPTLDEIKEAFTTSGPSPHLCRCGTYLAIVVLLFRQ